MSKNLTKLSDQQLLNRKNKGIRTTVLLAFVFVVSLTVVVLSIVYPDSLWWTITEAKSTSVVRPIPYSMPIFAVVFSAYGTVHEFLKVRNINAELAIRPAKTTPQKKSRKSK